MVTLQINYDQLTLPGHTLPWGRKEAMKTRRGEVDERMRQKEEMGRR